jgi:hypothetical protein
VPLLILLIVVLAVCVSPVARSTGGDVMLRWKPMLYPNWAPFPLTPFPNFTPTPVAEHAAGQATPGAQASGLPPDVTTLSRADWPKGRSDDHFDLLGEMQVGSYTVRRWQGTRMLGQIVTISEGDQIAVQVEETFLLVRMAGQDITGEGNPDVVVSSWSPNPLGAYKTAVYDLGPAVSQVLDVSPITCGDFLLGDACPCGGMFQDLDRDGVPEVIACDEAFHFRWTIPAEVYPCAPQQLVVLQYDRERGYVAASHRFPELYEARLGWLRGEANKAQREPQSPGEGPPCAVMALVLNYLYTGQPARAWAELDRRYDAPDKALWWVDTLHTLADSEYYEPAGSFPDVPLPDYYMLQLTTDCESPRWPIGVLQEGQEICDADVTQWDKWWLARRLDEVGLLSREEGLLTPDEGRHSCGVDCEAGCGLAIYRYGDYGDTGAWCTWLGAIHLDTAGGFPGEVYRVDPDGGESTHWRLRGDLSWESVSQ